MVPKAGFELPRVSPPPLSKNRCLTGGARASFPIQLNPVQYTRRPPERIRLHMGVSVRRQPDIRVSRHVEP